MKCSKTSCGKSDRTAGLRAVSRFLYPCGRQSFLWAGHCYPALATYPEVERDGPPLLPYLVLLRVGFAMPPGLLPARCALTAPFHPYPVSGAVFFLLHFPWPEFGPPAVSRHAALWRPDFPPPLPGATARSQPHSTIVALCASTFERNRGNTLELTILTVICMVSDFRTQYRSLEL